MSYTPLARLQRPSIPGSRADPYATPCVSLTLRVECTAFGHEDNLNTLSRDMSDATAVPA